MNKSFLSTIEVSMKSTSKLVSLLTVSIALAACGGGGSGGGSTPSVQPKPISPKENNVVAKPSADKKQEPINNQSKKEADKKKPEQPKQNVEQPKKDIVIPSKETKPTFEPSKEQLRELPMGKVENEDVGFGVVTGYNNKYSFNGAWKEVKNKNELTELLVDETKLSLANKFASFGGLKGIALSKVFESAWNVLNDDGSQRDVFYFGDETPVSVVDNQRGKAVYKGIATRYDNVKRKLDNVGKSTLNVDFDEKKVSGELAMDSLFRRNIVLEEGDIKDNRFEGVAIAGKNHVLRQVEGRYEGKFFGPNAEEVAGEARFKDKKDGGDKEAIIGNLKDLNTSFSAEKQTKK